MKRLCGAFALMFAMAGCSAIDVKGIVREEGTGVPLPGAAVMIGDESTTTDTRGFYHLEVDENDGDPQRMHVQKAGYGAFAEQVSFDEGADEILQDIELKKTAPDPNNPALPQNQLQRPEDSNQPVIIDDDDED
jgi:hypothetical protein